MQIGSISEFLDVITDYSDGARRLYYRGEARAEDHLGSRILVPKILRPDARRALSQTYDLEDPVLLQRAVLERLRRYAGSAPGIEGRFWEALCVAQHHGLPTLLLDWTLNPLAALFFGASRHETQDGVLWAMKLHPPTKRREQTLRLAEHSITDEDEDQERGPLVVVPRAHSDRIAAQMGRFIYFGRRHQPLQEGTSEPGEPWQQIRRWTIPKSAKPRINRELELLQVHEGTMFPGIDGFARYLARGRL